ncbi:hypothetical protein [Planococcus beigongshangi]|uniref:hypothetical protein n=1 Tax=Planococcus beigongshangi TaxID=2782536 RepID=UPI00193BAA55|nr:hypothetical protein [Planococcus beigongshangi]
MEYENRDDYIIKKYQQDEATMVQLFVNWSLSNDLDPLELYKRAYPVQSTNEVLIKALEDADSSEMDISDETILEILQMFGNDDLAFVVSEEMEKLRKRKGER